MAVDVSKMLPGDLIFYGDQPGVWTSVYHVGIYIGDGKMVHAPRPGDVVKVVPVWFSDFFGAHRVVCGREGRRLRRRRRRGGGGARGRADADSRAVARRVGGTGGGTHVGPVNRNRRAHTDTYGVRPSDHPVALKRRACQAGVGPRYTAAR